MRTLAPVALVLFSALVGCQDRHWSNEQPGTQRGGQSMTGRAAHSRSKNPKATARPILENADAGQNEKAIITAQNNKTESDGGSTSAGNVLDKRILELEKMVEDLRFRLRGRGRGAYSQGTHTVGTLSVGSSGLSETLLDRLYRVEQELSDAKRLNNLRADAINELSSSKKVNQETIASLESRIHMFKREAGKLPTAQAAFKSEKNHNKQLMEYLNRSEMDRMEIEKQYLQLMDEILRLKPDEIQEFMGLQKKLENTARNIAQSQSNNDSTSSTEKGQP